jgi:hypothetical protein
VQRGRWRGAISAVTEGASGVRLFPRFRERLPHGRDQPTPGPGRHGGRRRPRERRGGLGPGAPAADLSPRERLSLDFDWKFKLGHAQDPARDFGFGANQRTYAKAGASAPNWWVAAAPQKDFDDSAWAPVTLPHDWGVELPFVNNPDYKPTRQAR